MEAGGRHWRFLGGGIVGCREIAGKDVRVSVANSARANPPNRLPRAKKGKGEEGGIALACGVRKEKGCVVFRARYCNRKSILSEALGPETERKGLGGRGQEGERGFFFKSRLPPDNERTTTTPKGLIQKVEGSGNNEHGG